MTTPRTADNRASEAHPPSVDDVRQMTADETRLLGYLVQAASQGAMPVQLTSEAPGTISVTPDAHPRSRRAFVFSREGGFDAGVINVAAAAGCAGPAQALGHLNNLDRVGLLERVRQTAIGPVRRSGVAMVVPTYPGHATEVTEFGEAFARACLPAAPAHAAAPADDHPR